MITTFEEIKSHSPCGLEPGEGEGWDKLISTLGRDTGPVSLLEILDSNGVKDAYWALRCWDRAEYADLRADVAESVYKNWHVMYPDDLRVRACIDGWRALGRGEISDDDFEKLRRDAANTAATYASSAAATYASAAASCVYTASASAASCVYTASAYSYAASAATCVYTAAAATSTYAACAAFSCVARRKQWNINEKLMREFLTRRIK